MTLTFRSIRHHHFLSCMSFLTTKEGVIFRCIRQHDFDISEHPAPSFPFLYVFSDYKRGGDISLHPSPWHWHFGASGTIISFLVCLFWLQKMVRNVVASVPWHGHFVASGTIISFLVCFFWLQKRGWYFVASVTMTLTVRSASAKKICSVHSCWAQEFPRFYYTSPNQGILISFQSY